MNWDRRTTDRVMDFTDLRVWQSAMDLADRVYRLTWEFPRHENYGLAGQIQRAAVSIPSNIAEGNARGHLKEYVRFLGIARGSVAELKTQIMLAHRLGYLDDETKSMVIALVDHVARQLTALVRSLEASPRALKA